MDFDYRAYQEEDELERRRLSFSDLDEAKRTERTEYAGSSEYWD